MNARLAVALLMLACAGCGTARLYEGAKRDSDEVARITGDFVVTAGAPVTVILRQVDGHDLSVGENTAEVLPGKHRLLVDCRIAETRSVTRHEVEAEVFAGGHYRLAAETSPGLRGCTNVAVEETN